MENCNICKQKLNTGTVASRDCGGDCTQCMASAGDPDCIDAMRDVAVEQAQSDILKASLNDAFTNIGNVLSKVGMGVPEANQSYPTVDDIVIAYLNKNTHLLESVPAYSIIKNQNTQLSELVQDYAGIKTDLTKAGCHNGITTAAKCGRCSKDLKAWDLIETIKTQNDAQVKNTTSKPKMKL